MTVTRDVPVAHVFASALRGRPCVLWEGDRATGLLPTDAWLRDADHSDEALLALCAGPTIDIGCGPGRMAQALARRGRLVLGIDVVPEAVRQSRGRGVATLLRDVFDAVPGEGRWQTALLADGNIGIGGDPAALLSRVAHLLRPGGLVVADVAPPGAGLATYRLVLECGTLRSDPFPWTVVGADAVRGVASGTGLRLDAVHETDGRWFAVLAKEPC